MADRVGNRRLRRRDAGEPLHRQQLPGVVARQQHALGADEQDAGVPLLRGVLSERSQHVGQHPRPPAAVVPGELHRGQLAPRGELVAHLQPSRRALGVHGRAGGLDARRVPQLQRPERQVHVVAAEVAQPAAAEVPPASPPPGQVAGVVRPLGGRAEPQVPAQVLRHGRGVLGAPHAAVADGVPDVHLADGADQAPLDDLNGAAVVAAGVDLRAHLRDELLRAGQLDQRAALVDGVGQGLLAVAVLAHSHGHGRRGGVRVVGCADDHGVDVPAHGIQHSPEVGEGPGPGEPRGRLGEAAGVDVAQGDDVLALDAAEVGPPAPADADDGDVELLVGRSCLRPRAASQVRHRTGHGGRADQELTARHTVAHAQSLLDVCRPAISARRGRWHLGRGGSSSRRPRSSPGRPCR